MTPRPPFRADIEGIRGIAILLVVLYHARVPGFSGGYVGVDVFFVLSGYLITWLLVGELEATGRLDFARFYARRARRLLPAMFVVIAVTLVAGYVLYAPHDQRSLAETALATAAYVSNLFFASQATSYLAADAETNPLLHTWSLSVEEQFYLVWPLLVVVAFMGLSRQSASRKRLGVTMGVVTLVSFAASAWYTEIRQPWAFFGSPFRAWEFGAGGLGILVPRLRLAGRRRDGAVPGDHSVPGAIGWLGLAGVVGAGAAFSRQTSFPGMAALLPVVATVLLLRAGAPQADTRLARLLAARPLQAAGRLSYSWYLWHWPVLVFAAAEAGELAMPVRLALVVASLGLAEASYRLVEDPVRRNRLLSKRSAYSLGMAAALTLSAVGLALAGRAISIVASESPRQIRYTRAADDHEDVDCHAATLDDDLVECWYGPRASSRTVVLFGDSHAGQWIPTLKRIAEREGWRAVTLLKSACPAVFTEVEYKALGRTFRECEAWQTKAVARVRELQPDLLLVTSANKRDLSLEDWTRGTERAVAELGAAAGSVVVIRDTPAPDFDVPSCLARQAWRNHGRVSAGACSFDPAATARADIFAMQRRVAAAHPSVHTLDLTGEICPDSPCLPVRDGIIIYRDSHHLSATFAASLAPALTRRLETLVGTDAGRR